MQSLVQDSSKAVIMYDTEKLLHTNKLLYYFVPKKKNIDFKSRLFKYCILPPFLSPEFTPRLVLLMFHPIFLIVPLNIALS